MGSMGLPARLEALHTNEQNSLSLSTSKYKKLLKSTVSHCRTVEMLKAYLYKHMQAGGMEVVYSGFIEQGLS